jgi:hypothetical protein
MTDHTRLLEEARARWDADAFDPSAPPARDLLDRIVTTPPVEARPRRARAARRVAAALAVATAAVTIALVALPGASPDVIARAAEALETSSGEALVYTGKLSYGSAADRSDAKVIDVEGRESGQVGGFSTSDPDMSAMDLEERKNLGFRAPLSNVSLDDLHGLLERARDGEGSVTLVGEATVRDRAVYELRMDLGAEGVRTLYVDRESYEPVRFEHDGPGDEWATLDFLKVERMSAEAAGFGAPGPDRPAEQGGRP